MPPPKMVIDVLPWGKRKVRYPLVHGQHAIPAEHIPVSSIHVVRTVNIFVDLDGLVRVMVLQFTAEISLLPIVRQRTKEFTKRLIEVGAELCIVFKDQARRHIVVKAVFDNP